MATPIIIPVHIAYPEMSDPHPRHYAGRRPKGYLPAHCRASPALLSGTGRDKNVTETGVTV